MRRLTLLATLIVAFPSVGAHAPPEPRPSAEPVAQGAERPEPIREIPLDMLGGWYRRDWDGCEGASTVEHEGRTIRIASDRSAVKYWQSPTLVGGTLRFADEGWLRSCDRPPQRFARDMLHLDEIRDLLIPVRDFPVVRWSWSVDRPVDDARTADAEGKIDSAGDDFAAKLGFQIVPHDSIDLREIAYVWTRTIPEETLLVQETRILFFHWRFYRIVARSGEPSDGLEPVVRNLYDDYKRIWPDEEPGRVVRIYLMTDGDNTGTTAEGAYSDLRFLSRKPD